MDDQDQSVPWRSAHVPDGQAESDLWLRPGEPAPGWVPAPPGSGYPSGPAGVPAGQVGSGGPLGAGAFRPGGPPPPGWGQPSAPGWVQPPAPGPLPIDASGTFGPQRVQRVAAPILLGLAAIALALLVGGGVVWLLKPGSDRVQPPAPPVSESASASDNSAGSPDAERTPPETTREPTPPAEDPQAEARRRLEEKAVAGLAQVDFDGRLAVRMASKSNGIRDPLQRTSRGTHTFYYADILAEHERLAAGDNRGATVVLLRSTDYGARRTSPDGLPLYITMALDDFDSEDDIAAWCRRRFPDLSVKERNNTCLATRLRP